MVDILNSLDGRWSGTDADGVLRARDFADTGDPKVIAKKMYSSVAASTAITNTATETEFDAAYTLPANIFKVGSLLRIRYQGIQTAQNSTNTLGIKLYVGGKAGTALQTISAAQGAANNIFAGEFYLAVRTVGASGTFVGWGSYTAVPAASGTATMVVGVKASTAIDTTAAQKIAVAATWSAASASNSVRLDYMTLEML